MLENIDAHVLLISGFLIALENIVKVIWHAFKTAKSPIDKTNSRIHDVEEKTEDHEHRITDIEIKDFQKSIHDLRHRVDRLEDTQRIDHNDIATMQQGINILLKCQLMNDGLDDNLKKEVTDYVVAK